MDVKVFDSNYFETKTDTRFMLMDTLLGAIFFFPFLLFYLFIKLDFWYIWLLCYIAIVALCYFVHFYRFSATLIFKGDNVCIMRHFKKEMVVYHTTRDAFGFSQTKREKKHGLGTVYIMGTDYYFSGIRNFEAMKQYINTHFSEREHK